MSERVPDSPVSRRPNAERFIAVRAHPSCPFRLQSPRCIAGRSCAGERPARPGHRCRIRAEPTDPVSCALAIVLRRCAGLTLDSQHEYSWFTKITKENNYEQSNPSRG